MNIQIIVPAAGESKRFTRKGIKLPKPLIKFSWGQFPKQTMLEHATHGLEDWPINVGVLRNHQGIFLEGLIKSNHTFTFHSLGTSLGQADTVAQVARGIKGSDDCSLLILNSDSMFLYPLETFLAQVKDFDGGAIVFDGQYSPAYSYADEYPLFDKTAEKEPISPWAFAGAFYFKSKNDFLTAYEAYHWVIQREEYLSEVYNYLPGKKLAVYVPREQWIVWGTAEELMSDENVNDLEF